MLCPSKLIAPWREAVEIVANLLQVFPGLALLRRIAQQIGRMKRRHDLDASKVLKLSAHAGDPLAYFQQIPQRCVAHHDDHVRVHRGDLTKQKRPADRRFLQSGLAIARRPAAIDVADEHFFSLHANRFDDLCEQLSRAAYEGLALRVFISAGRFSDKHQTRLMIAMSIDHLRAAFTQTAARALADVAPDIFHLFFGLGE